MQNEFSVVLKLGKYGIGVYAIEDMHIGKCFKLYNKENVLTDQSLSEVPKEFLKLVIKYGEKCTRPKDFNHIEPAWYLNHSCDPNIEEDWDKGVYKVIKEIKKGDELLVDYNHFEEPESSKEEFYKK
jgi:SET domain-containing protein